MTDRDFDIAVVGAGATGLAAALAFARDGYRTVLVGAPDARADGRSVALLDGSVRLFESLSAWPDLQPVAAPLEVMRIIDDTGSLFRPPPAAFSAGEIGLDAFGWNIENGELVSRLAGIAGRREGLVLVQGQATGFDVAGDLAELRLADGESLRAKLVVAADGRRSRLREIAGIETRTWSYPQKALTTILTHDRRHRETSTEFHTRHGPFTLVPLPGRRSSLVWVAEPAEADALADLDDAALSLRIERQAHSILGSMRVDGPRGVFPMTGMAVSRFTSPRLALVGEAAHVFPPIGAQGLNLGLFNLLAPFFGLIGLGFFCGRMVRQPEAGLAWMQFFLIYVALPALFFRLIVDKPLDQLANWPFVALTTLSTALIFLMGFAMAWRRVRDLPESVMQGVAAAYSNVGYMGPPLVLGAIGAAASAPVVLIFVFDNLLLFSLVPLLMSVAGVEKLSPAATLRRVFWRILTHPFNVATALGIIFSYLHLPIPPAADQMVTWLAGAAAPCALFILGVTVAMRPLWRIPEGVPLLAFLKLVGHPLATWFLLSLFGDFGPVWTYAAITMAALPPALNIFVVASQYNVGVERASACVLIGTIGSVATLTILLYVIRIGALPYDLFP